MSTENVVAAKYAKALLALAREEQMADQIQQELELVDQYFARGGGQVLFSHPLLSLEKKTQLIKRILGEQVSPLIFSFIRLLLEKRRGQLLGLIFTIYKSEWLEQQNRKLAKITTAIPLSPGQIQRLHKRLHTIYEGEIEVQQVVDPLVQAGARLEVGDLVLDGTLQARFERLRRVMYPEN
ncbi:ATP synthase F1 subunit delta [candidate division FCPU426 bacterium]|nr:ATP synthase F1 subunit delta [candidate division FCPU426 bacterium]